MDELNRRKLELVNKTVNLLENLKNQPENLNSQVALLYVLREMERQQEIAEMTSDSLGALAGAQA